MGLRKQMWQRAMRSWRMVLLSLLLLLLLPGADGRILSRSSSSSRCAFLVCECCCRCCLCVGEVDGDRRMGSSSAPASMSTEVRRRLTDGRGRIFRVASGEG